MLITDRSSDAKQVVSKAELLEKCREKTRRMMQS